MSEVRYNATVNSKPNKPIPNLSLGMHDHATEKRRHKK